MTDAASKLPQTTKRNAAPSSAVREEIADLLERYAHTLDDGRAEAWSGFFEEGAVYQVTTRENVEAGRPIGIVLCEGRGMMDDRIKAMRIANIFESHTHRHLVGRPLISARDDGRWDVRSSFAIYRIMYTGQTDLFATGCYQDVIAPGPEGWRFAARRVVLDSRSLDTLMVYPL
ncbi:MAG: aromatic-ring-hydroxylating dioxygenase subunit beta [Gammaproteobacteria bacterium]|nr:aromatic-ring-hydroxylating dioxygenase subunit beta [Gammaproteobacteria bacterium]